MKVYKFKSNGVILKDCEHIFEYDNNFKMLLLWRLIKKYNLTLNNDSFEKICNEFDEFVEEKYELNKKGEWIISHYSSIDIGVEILQDFEYFKFGKKSFAIE